MAFRGLPEVISFGAATYGFPTGNETVALPAGALLHLTTSRFADRTGRTYDGPLEPDVRTADPLASAIARLSGTCA